MNEYPPEYDRPCVEFERVETRRARVPHRCSCCVAPIAPGQIYTRIFAVLEGEPQTQVHHGLVIGECIDPNAWR